MNHPGHNRISEGQYALYLGCKNSSQSNGYSSRTWLAGVLDACRGLILHAVDEKLHFFLWSKATGIVELNLFFHITAGMLFCLCCISDKKSLFLQILECTHFINRQKLSSGFSNQFLLYDY